MESFKSLIRASKEIRAHRSNGNMEPLIGVSVLSQENAEEGLAQLPMKCNATHRQICFGQVLADSTMHWDYIAVEPAELCLTKETEMEKTTSKQSLRLAADMVDRHHKMGNRCVKIACSAVSHNKAVSQLEWGTYEVSDMSAYFVAEGFVANRLRRWKFLAVEPLPEGGEKLDSKSYKGD